MSCAGAELGLLCRAVIAIDLQKLGMDGTIERLESQAGIAAPASAGK